MALIARQNQVEAGLDLVLTAAAGGGDQVDNADGKTIVIIRNGGGASITATVTAQNTSFGNQLEPIGQITKTNVARTIAAGGIAILGPFPTAVYNNTSNQIALTYSGVTSVVVSPVKLP